MAARGCETPVPHLPHPRRRPRVGGEEVADRRGQQRLRDEQGLVPGLAVVLVGMVATIWWLSRFLRQLATRVTRWRSTSLQRS